MQELDTSSQPTRGMTLVSLFLERVSHRTGLFLSAPTSKVSISPLKKSRVTSETQDKLLAMCTCKIKFHACTIHWHRVMPHFFLCLAICPKLNHSFLTRIFEGTRSLPKVRKAVKIAEQRRYLDLTAYKPSSEYSELFPRLG